MSAARRIILNVPDISCAHCKMAIEKAVAALDGVEAAAVDVESRTVELRLDEGRSSLDAVKRTIGDEGYTVAGEHVFDE